MRTAYRCRAYPDRAQQQTLNRTFGCVRVVRDRTLAARQARWHLDGTSTSHAESGRALTAMKRDFLHRAGTRLVRENDVVVIEDLNVSGTVRNHHLARAIPDCGWGEFRRQLACKCQRYGRELVVIDRWYPSSKTCSACGHMLAELSLSTGMWGCPSCGARHDRDVNAAKNIVAAGRAVTRGSQGGACGAEVRHTGSSRVHSAANQEPRPARTGIPVFPGGE